jgi:hypothetical protein
MSLGMSVLDVTKIAETVALHPANMLAIPVVHRKVLPW